MTPYEIMNLILFVVYQTAILIVMILDYVENRKQKKSLTSSKD